MCEQLWSTEWMVYPSHAPAQPQVPVIVPGRLGALHTHGALLFGSGWGRGALLGLLGPLLHWRAGARYSPCGRPCSSHGPRGGRGSSSSSSSSGISSGSSLVLSGLGLLIVGTLGPLIALLPWGWRLGLRLLIILIGGRGAGLPCRQLEER